MGEVSQIHTEKLSRKTGGCNSPLAWDTLLGER